MRRSQASACLHLRKGPYYHTLAHTTLVQNLHKIKGYKALRQREEIALEDRHAAVRPGQQGPTGEERERARAALVGAVRQLVARLAAKKRRLRRHEVGGEALCAVGSVVVSHGAGARAAN